MTAHGGWLIHATKDGSLSQSDIDAYNSLGFLAIADFASADECASLRERAEAIVDAFEPETISIFSTGENQKKTTDAYFLASGNNVSCFFEEKAFDESGALAVEKSKSINKIGHALHDIEPAFRCFSRSSKVRALLHSLGMREPTPVQSMYIFKQPAIGGAVTPHQDSTFLNTEPPTCLGIWLALEDCTVENGCLFALKGTPEVTRRMEVDYPGGTREISFTGEAPEYDLTDAVPMEVPKGTLVLLHGANVHFSKANTSPHSRHAYSVHYIDTSRAKWRETNWLQRAPDFPFARLDASEDKS